MSVQRFQLDIAARLQGAAYFADVPVFVLRPRASATATQIQDKINASLGALTAQNGKSGLCATVLMPAISTQRPELPGPYLHVQCTVRVQENVIVNMGANGTRIACEDAAVAVAQTLHLWTPGGTAGIVRAGAETIRPEKPAEGRVTYDVLVESELDLACLAKSPLPFPTATAGFVTIACADPEAVIYYTIDGSLPWAGTAGNVSTAEVYSAPFAAATGTLVRCAAYSAGELGSDVNWLQL